MDKLSLYDLLSFLLPGFIAFELLHYWYNLAGLDAIHTNYQFSDFEEGLLGVTVSLIVGLALHQLSFYLALRTKIGKLVYRDMSEVFRNSRSINQIKAPLESYCVTAVGMDLNNKKAAGRFFDHVYYFLEANDKISPSKGFQSLHFFSRNLFFLGVFNIVPLLVFMVLAINQRIDASIRELILALILHLFALPLLMAGAHFARRKMAERIFWTYYILKHDPLKQ